MDVFPSTITIGSYNDNKNLYIKRCIYITFYRKDITYEAALLFWIALKDYGNGHVISCQLIIRATQMCRRVLPSLYKAILDDVLFI